ncbi:MAG: type II toxin-antitoxin system prevent-host-death family antitoxin [Bifidobacteriaceae bacterium]|jgi:prevent-host-death family protein|nr:type II toxin-antitoxin system prevent-host-death family antitoxin [Bifidobacteriaceae bacterium]
MVTNVGVAQAHNRLSELIDEALKGADVVISRRSRPVVRLVPVEGVAPGSGALVAATARRVLAQSGARRSTDQILSDLRADRESWR